jgi:hypothetical protein
MSVAASASPSAGRSCPLHCRYPPSVFGAEQGEKRLVFNGDFHWFDADPAVFDRIQRGVLAHQALRGNVETEIAEAAPQDDAGWGFAQEHLRAAAHRDAVRGWFDQADVDLFACTHTCLPVLQALRVDGSVRWVGNNGAAGMPSFAADGAGPLTRIAMHPFDGPQRRFVAQWPVGSDAHRSYFERISRGPAYRLQDALRAGEMPATPAIPILDPEIAP